MLTRRQAITMTAGAAFSRGAARPQTRFGTQRMMSEWSFTSGKAYADPFHDVELDVVITGPDGKNHRVPAFWAGEQTWRVRFAPPLPGRYSYRTVATDRGNTDLHERSGSFEVTPYSGSHALYGHGPLRVSASKRYLEHTDGTPFFWLGDTWWLGLTQRLRWPAEFRRLTADRVRKGFSVIQIVAGLFPDMDSFDPRGRNEAGFPWEPDYRRINPAFFDAADLRIEFLVERGLVPCILGCWGYYLPKLGAAKMKQHWRYLVARWGAYPVVWCLAGETTMPYYLSETKERDREELRKGWTEIARYVRSIDPAGHPITAHPSHTARDSVEDPAVLDFDLLQTGHGDRKSIPNTIKTIEREVQALPKMPVINGEVCYEGILEASREEMQRFMFWTCMLSGAAGHTYGANGIWQVNREGDPYGPSPHGRTWGNVPWNVAAELPGSGQVGLGANLLRSYEWWRFEPHPEWAEPHWTHENYELAYAAGISGQVRFLYLPAPANTLPKVKGLETGVRYKAFFFNPSDGVRHSLGDVAAESGEWQVPQVPAMRDWVVVLER